MIDACISGGAVGADATFDEFAFKANHTVIHCSFRGHRHAPGLRGVVRAYDPRDLSAADPYLHDIAKKIGRRFSTRKAYVASLLRRNYFIVSPVSTVYAVGWLDEEGGVEGGTAWGVAQAVGQVPVFFYCQHRDRWFSADVNYGDWVYMDARDVYEPSGIYAGIGSRRLTESGRAAIETLYTTPVMTAEDHERAFREMLERARRASEERPNQ